MSAVAETLFEGKQKEDVCKNQANMKREGEREKEVLKLFNC